MQVEHAGGGRERGEEGQGGGGIAGEEDGGGEEFAALRGLDGFQDLPGLGVVFQTEIGQAEVGAESRVRRSETEGAFPGFGGLGGEALAGVDDAQIAEGADMTGLGGEEGGEALLGLREMALA